MFILDNNDNIKITKESKREEKLNMFMIVYSGFAVIQLVQ